MFLHHFGSRNTVIVIAGLLIVAQNSILCLLQFQNDTQMFILYSLLAQTLGGLGAGANSTSSMAILSSFEPQEREMYIGTIEACNGVGLLLGPLMGGLLYSFGGYMMPFATFAAIYVALYPYIIYTLVSASRVVRGAENEQPEAGGIMSILGSKKAEKEEIKVGKLLGKPRFVYGLLSQMMLLMSIQYLAPNLAI
jgi:MFS family permease